MHPPGVPVQRDDSPHDNQDVAHHKQAHIMIDGFCGLTVRKLGERKMQVVIHALRQKLCMHEHN